MAEKKKMDHDKMMVKGRSMQEGMTRMTSVPLNDKKEKPTGGSKQKQPDRGEYC